MSERKTVGYLGSACGVVLPRKHNRGAAWIPRYLCTEGFSEYDSTLLEAWHSMIRA